MMDPRSQHYIGVANIPNAYHRACSKRLLSYNILLVGESGSGKSAFIRTMFGTEVDNISDAMNAMQEMSISDKDHSVSYEPLNQALLGSDTAGKLMERVSVIDLDKESNTRLQRYHVSFQEKAFQIDLSITSTVEFGNAIHSHKASEVFLDYIDSKYEDYLRQEMEISRKPAEHRQDDRIHVCLYFIPATRASRLTPLDLISMKKIGNKVNLIPIISKADVLTADERNQLKKNMLNELNRYQIRVYEMPDISPCFDPEQRERYIQIHEAMPFAIIGSGDEVAIDGSRFKGRVYPWGKVECEEESLNDLPKLRCLLIRTHLYDLLQTTNNHYYEIYRQEKLFQKLVTRPYSEIAGAVLFPTQKALEASHEETMRQLYLQHQKELQSDQNRLDQLEYEHSETISAKEREVQDLKLRVETLEQELGDDTQWSAIPNLPVY
jgi:septin family protein